MSGTINITVVSGLKEDVDVDNIMVEDEEGGVVATAAVEVKILLKGAKKYIVKALRPNVHLGVYYSQFYK